MPRNPEMNAMVREERRKQILDAALTVYTRFGYHGTDMDAVAREAKLAKGLLYYYYKTKKDLFVELFTWMFDEGYRFSDTLLKKAEQAEPVEQLMHYVFGMFGANRKNRRMMQFFFRAPFDAYAVFGTNPWKDGAEKSDMHRKALAKLIEMGMANGTIPPADPSRSANSFWSVFVANTFEYSKLMTGTQESQDHDADILREVVRFCFQGLGVDNNIWNSCLKNLIVGHPKGDCDHEGL